MVFVFLVFKVICNLVNFIIEMYKGINLWNILLIIRGYINYILFYFERI